LALHISVTLGERDETKWGPVDLQQRIRERKIVQWAVVYLAGAWLSLEAFGFVADAFNWSPAVVRSAVLIVAVGFLAILVLAWFHGEQGRQRISGMEAALLAALALVAVVLVVTLGRVPEPPAPAPSRSVAAAEVDRPSVAVVPFSVRGDEMELWQEGLVDLLSINLDGSALRAIDSRTVLARWHERTAGGVEADLETALAVARETGARHVVIGTALATGSQVRLAANVRDVENGALVHQAQVDTHVDSMIPAVDELSIELLRFLLRELETQPRANLASVTTGSIEALKSFLNGEQLYRRGEYAAADDAYSQAVSADSSFALALYRLGLTRGWTEAAGTELAEGPLARADSLANLPQRERGLVRAALAMVRSDGTEIDSTRVLAARYPDDAEAWYLLGELYLHEGFARLVGWEETEEAFLRAVDLDPTWAPYHIHLVDLAFRYHADSALAVERIGRYRELAPESFWNRYYDLLFAIAFGDESARRAAMDELRAGELLDVERVSDRLDHPAFWPAREELLQLERNRGSESQGIDALRNLILINIYARGWLDAAMGYQGDALASRAVSPCDYLFTEVTLGIATHPFESELALERIESDSVGLADPEAHISRLACSALYAVYRGREGDHRLLRDRLDAIIAVAATQDTSTANYFQSLQLLIDGFEAWLGGDSQAAYDILSQFTPRDDLSIPSMGNAQILLDVERPDEALPYLLAMRSNPVARFYLGRAYEALGRDAEAREAYEYFLSSWADADLDLMPLVDRARRALTRIAARLN
jgi:TolB-like protein